MRQSFKQRALKVARRSVPLTCAAFFVDNVLATIGATSADPALAEHLAGVDLERDLCYARNTAELYRTRGGPVRGCIAEIGPWGNASVALNLMAHGVESVDLIDRFAFSHDSARLAAMYDAVIRSEPALTERFGEDRTLPIRSFVGEAAAAERFFQNHGGYDAILSCAVLEHVSDPLGALRDMAAALNAGGKLYHQVDCRDHGMFAGRHELTFLEIPGWLYPYLTRRRGRPNRVLVHRYREVMVATGLEFEILVTKLVGVGEVGPAPFAALPQAQREAALSEVRARRHRFAREFAATDDADLAVSGFFLRAWKPRAQAAAA